MDISIDNMELRPRENELFIHRLFTSRQLKNPQSIAIQFGNKRLTYNELHEASDSLSAVISETAPDSPYIAVSTSRSIEMIVGVLAILKSGKAYLPLDPSYPKDRLKQIIQDAGLGFCVALEKERNFWQELGLNLISSSHIEPKTVEQPKNSGSLAYVLYTSGSTGIPKGVCMGHAAMINLISWQEKHSNAGHGSKTLQFAPLSFDVSFQEIFSTLCTGGTLVLIEDDLRLDPTRLLQFIEAETINRIFLPFVALQYLTEAADAGNLFPMSLQEVMTAGEQLKITPQVIRFFEAIPHATLYNQYGPTEAHVVSELKLTGAPRNWPSLPSIGKAIDHTRLLVLDENMKMLSAGETGELFLSGICLAEGYLKQPAMTAEKFIEWKDEYGNKQRIYRTGDQAKLMADGNIEFLGRKDDQVKIRGYRVELGEIEVLLSKQRGIQQAVVTAREDVPGQKRLVAYLVSSNELRDIHSIRKAIEEELPDYMMPAAFVWLNQLPKT
ncbi:MAG TPA: amino acid adenylation domain-containing protein, partial [Puia sp.]|nr:amino acid adenylation domain-containing protein [Puia sp.]